MQSPELHRDPVKIPDIPSPGNQSLVEAELVASVAWLIRLRWIAGLGVLVGTWTTGALFGLDAPTGALYTIGTGILVYNLVFYLVERRISQPPAAIAAFRELSVWQTILDWLAMTLLIHYSGGIESPVIFFFLFHIILASFFFSPRGAYAFALLAAVLLSAIALLELSGVLQHQPIGGFLDAPLYQNGLYVAAVLAFFTSTDLIAAYLAVSIQGRLRQREEQVVRLSENLHRASLRLQTLNEGARAINSTLELSQVLDRLVTSTAEAMGVKACSIRLLAEDGQRLDPVAVYGLSKAYLDKGPVDALSNPMARRVLSGEIVNVPEVTDSSLLQYPEAATQEGIRALLSAPLIGKRGPMGILRAYAVKSGHFTQEDEAFLAAIAAQGSIAIENAMAYHAIEELDQAKGQFIRTVTHELRSPVSVVSSLLRTLTAGYAGQVSSQQADILERARRRVEFLQRLIDDLLDLAAGKIQFLKEDHLEPVALDNVVAGVVQRFEVLAKEKDIALEWHPGDSPKMKRIMASVEGIDRIFNNLISNAIKYTPAGGRVAVSSAGGDGHTRVEVADTGIGIPAEAMGHLFEEFYRAPNARSVEHEGTGLGLTIARNLVMHYGGNIKVESTLGSGTRFIVTLPLAEE